MYARTYIWCIYIYIEREREITLHYIYIYIYTYILHAHVVCLFVHQLIITLCACKHTLNAFIVSYRIETCRGATSVCLAVPTYYVFVCQHGPEQSKGMYDASSAPILR